MHFFCSGVLGWKIITSLDQLQLYLSEPQGEDLAVLWLVRESGKGSISIPSSVIIPKAPVGLHFMGVTRVQARRRSRDKSILTACWHRGKLGKSEKAVIRFLYNCGRRKMRQIKKSQKLAIFCLLGVAEVTKKMKPHVPCFSGIRRCREGKSWIILELNDQPRVVETFIHTMINKTRCSRGCFTKTLMIHWLSHSSFVDISSIPLQFQTIWARDLKFWENVHLPPCVKCHISRFKCHMSHNKRRVSHVNLNFRIKKKKLNGGANCWRVCYQWGLPRLVLSIF